MLKAKEKKLVLFLAKIYYHSAENCQCFIAGNLHNSSWCLLRPSGSLQGMGGKEAVRSMVLLSHAQETTHNRYMGKISEKLHS